MDISPLEIQKKEFASSFRGYNKEEVDDFLDKVTFDYEKIYKENKDLREEVNNLKEQINSYKELELTLKNTLVMAEKTAEEVKNNALRERNSILKEAMVKAQDILNRAEQKYSSSNDKIEELRRQFYLYKTRFRNFVQSQIDFLDSFELNVLDDEDKITNSFLEVAASEDSGIDYSHEDIDDTTDIGVLDFEKKSEEDNNQDIEDNNDKDFETQDIKE